MIPTPPKLSSQQAYDRLVEMILNGEIREDHPISERGISEAVGIGRTPIREAVKDLVRDGVLESHPARGTTLRPLTPVDLQELYEIRYAIEGLAAFLAAERGRLEELEPYAKAFEATLEDPQATDMVRVYDHGVEFHYAIIKLAANKRLLEIYRPFRIRFRIPFGIVRTRSPERVLASVSEHLAICRAIGARDAERARHLMCEHLRIGLQFRMDMLLRKSGYSSPYPKGS
jgi:DNA-binding GntR family transcriptional regulator